MLVRVQPEEPISSFSSIRQYVERLNVSRGTETGRWKLDPGGCHWYPNESADDQCTPPPVLAVDGTRSPNPVAVVAETPLAVQVGNGSGDAGDWIGLFPSDATNERSAAIDWKYLNDLQSAPTSGRETATVFLAPLPSTTEQYEVCLLNAANQLLATPVPVSSWPVNTALGCTWTDVRFCVWPKTREGQVGDPECYTIPRCVDTGYGDGSHVPGGPGGPERSDCPATPPPCSVSRSTHANPWINYPEGTIYLNVLPQTFTNPGHASLFDAARKEWNKALRAAGQRLELKLGIGPYTINVGLDETLNSLSTWGHYVPNMQVLDFATMSFAPSTQYDTESFLSHLFRHELGHVVGLADAPTIGCPQNYSVMVQADPRVDTKWAEQLAPSDRCAAARR